MSPQSFALVLHHFRRLSRGWTAGGGVSDASLLERFHSRHDREAFAELVERHGPLVLRTCRRILARTPDVEDAFQATFLILARKSRSIQRPRSIASWLYTVAHRVAWNARAAGSRRRTVEQPMPDMRWVEEELGPAEGAAASDPARLAQRRELEAVIEQELGRLPEKYRALLLLCDLQGRTHTEAARELGLPQGSVSRHLERGRALLRERLRRRGLGLGAAALAAALAETAQAAVPAAWVHTVSEAAVLCASGAALPAGLLSARALTLSQGVLRAMWMKTLRMILLSALAIGVLAGGAGLLGFAASGADPAPGAQAPLPQDDRAPAGEPARKQEELPAGVRLRLSISEKPKEQQGMVFFMGVQQGGLFFSADGEHLYVQRGGAFGGVGLGGGGVGLLGGAPVPPPPGPGGNPPPGPGGNPPPGPGANPPPPGFRGNFPPGKQGGGFLPPGGRPGQGPPGGAPPGGAGALGGGGGAIGGPLPGGGNLGALGGGPGQNIGLGGMPAGGVAFVGGGMNFPQQSLGVWNVATKKKEREIAPAHGAILSPSGKSIGLVSMAQNKQVVRLINARTGATYQDCDLSQGIAGPGGIGVQGGMLGGPGFGGLMLFHGNLAFSPDGKRLTVPVGMDVRQWDVPTNKLLKPLNFKVMNVIGYMPDGKQLIGLGMPAGLRMLGGNPFAPAPAPQANDNAPEGRVVVWDLAGGKAVRSFGDQTISYAVKAPKSTTVATFSQQGLLLGGLGGFGGPAPAAPAAANDATTKIQLWDAATGKELLTINTKLNLQQGVRQNFNKGMAGGGGFGFIGFAGGMMDAAFSDDGRILASCLSTAEGGHVQLWDVKTGKELVHITTAFFPQAVALSRDGSMLAAAGSAEALELRVWDVPGFASPGTQVRFDASQFPVLWNDLASDDLGKALRAERTLSAAPAATVLPLLRDKLRPVLTSGDEGRRIAQLIADLESEQFKVRDKATQELGRSGTAAISALKQALTEKKTIEFQRRAQALLTRLEAGAVLTPEQRRQQRALAVVEFMGIPEARQLLAQLAGGTPEAWFTQEARAAQMRLGESKLIAPNP